MVVRTKEKGAASTLAELGLSNGLVLYLPPARGPVSNHMKIDVGKGSHNLGIKNIEITRGDSPELRVNLGRFPAKNSKVERIITFRLREDGTLEAEPDYEIKSLAKGKGVPMNTLFEAYCDDEDVFSTRKGKNWFNELIATILSTTEVRDFFKGDRPPLPKHYS